MPQGSSSRPCCQLVNGHFFQQGTPEPPGLCLPPLGSPAHIAPAQSNAAGGTGDLEATREGTRCFSLPEELVHSRAIASLPMSLGRTPFFQKAMTLTVDMTITLRRHTHTLLSKALTQELQITWQPVKTIRWETYMASPAALRRLCIGGGDHIKPIQKMKYCKDS